MSPSSIKKASPACRFARFNNSPWRLGLIKLMDILLLIFDDSSGTRSATGLRDTIFPMRRTDEAKRVIALKQKLRHSCEILKYVGLNFVLLTCESAVQGICSDDIPWTIHNQCQNYSMVIASLRYSLPAGGAVVEPTKWINRGPSKAEMVQLCEQTKWSSLPHCQIASKHIGDEKSIIHLLTLVNNTPFYYSSLQLFPQKSSPPLRPVI